MKSTATEESTMNTAEAYEIEQAETAHDRKVAARKPRKSKRPEYTPEEREEYRRAQREQAAELMKAGLAELQSSEGWRRWAEMRARLHTYSFANTILILCQMPDASLVMSGKKWNAIDRRMSAGTRALRVFAPLFRKPTADEIAAGRKPDEQILYSFKLVPVFDVSQTEGEPVPAIPVQPLDGDSHAAYLRPLEKLAQSLGYSVSFEDLSEGLGGYVNPTAKHIAITKNAAPNQQVKTLIHEIAHALGFDYTDYTREQSEVLVETAAFIVASSIGLDTSSYSIGYCATWGEGDAAKHIEAFATQVDKVARRIERAVTDAEIAA